MTTYYDPEEDDLLRALVTAPLDNFGAVATALLKLHCTVDAELGCLDTVMVDVSLDTTRYTQSEFLALVAGAVEPLGGKVEGMGQ